LAAGANGFVEVTFAANLMRRGRLRDAVWPGTIRNGLM
jgi:hypothetical protein